MGIPKFYRWVSERYPLINQRIGKDIEFLPHFDNMYLDMNGIIHTCTHPNDQDVSDKISMKDMVLGMFAYVDHMVHIVRPQKVLMLAVDGCAPRAKMNQQRSRRFASAKERRESTEEAVRTGRISETEAREQFDSNCITPGTAFMEEVSRHFQYFIRLKIKEDPLWRKLKVIYSGHDVPGEGEHKIMDYIRHSKMQPDYNPNLRHCVCGLDADLIMLALASHEPHFALLREQVDFTGGRGKKAGSQTTKEVKKQVEQDKWELLHVSALRQYLDLEFRNDSLSFGYDLERVIDDFVLLCMLVGNDFLPHLPSLSIVDGGLDDLLENYKQLLPTLKGYLTEGTKVNLDRLQVMLKTIGDREDTAFAIQEKRAASAKGRHGHKVELDEGDDAATAQSPFGQIAREQGIVTEFSSRKVKYYGEKFGISSEHVDVHDKIRRSYVEGLQWCFMYYYQGVQSWTWFYPFHYAPMASDLEDITDYHATLRMGQPFRPFMQLLSCLPADSAIFLPDCYRQLMTLNTSPIADFYPRDFKVDMNGKAASWEGVNLLPFIDEKRLFEAVALHCPDEKLTQTERDRNTFGHEIIFELDLANTSKVPSSFPSAGLMDIEVCNSSAKRFCLPPMDKFVPNLLPGAIANGLFPGDPQLLEGLTIREDVRGSLEQCHLNIFGKAARGRTFVVHIRNPANIPLLEPSSTKSLAEGIVPYLENLQAEHKNTRLTVYVNFPNLRQAEVLAVADEDYVFTLQEEKKKIFRFHKSVQTEADSVQFQSDAREAEIRALSGTGVVGGGGLTIGNVDVMILVRPLQSLRVDHSDGSTSQIFSEMETWVPYQLVCFQNTAPDQRLLPARGKSVEERFPKNSQVMCLQDSGYGMVGRVVSYADHSHVYAEFNNQVPQIPQFGHTVAASVVDEYVPSYKAAKHLGIDASTLGKVTGTIRVRPGRFDLGLNLKVGRNYVIPGYVRSRANEATKPPWSGGESVTVISGLDAVEIQDEESTGAAAGGWEFTPRAIELVAAYKKKFPKIFEALARNPSTVEYQDTDLFGLDKHDSEAAQENIEKVCKWLEQIDTYRLPLVPISSKFMSRDAIRAVQAASDDVQKQMLKTKHNKIVKVKLSAKVLYGYDTTSEAAWFKSPSSSVPPRLGDRCCNMSNPVVPFGLAGTVVATHASTGCVEVVFDTNFVGGTSLYGSCSPGRGKLLPWSQVLNLSKMVALHEHSKPQVHHNQPVHAKVKKPASTKQTTAAKVVLQKPKPQSTDKKPEASSQHHSGPPLGAKKLTVEELMAPPTEQKPHHRSSGAEDDAEATHAFEKLHAPQHEDDLVSYFHQLEVQRKEARANRRNRGNTKGKSTEKAATAPQTQVTPKEVTQTTAIPASIPVAPPPAPEVVPATVVQKEHVEDELDVLFRRATTAAGKQYKHAENH